MDRHLEKERFLLKITETQGVKLSMLHGMRKPDPDELNALAWAAKRAGLSYGQYYNQLTPEKISEILEKYRAMKQKQRDNEAARLKQNKKKKR